MGARREDAKLETSSFRLRGDKRRYWAIERVGDGPQQLGLHFLDDAVGGHGLGAGVQDVLLDLGHRLAEPVQGGSTCASSHSASGSRRSSTWAASRAAARLAGRRMRPCPAHPGRGRPAPRAGWHNPRQRLESVILDDRLAGRQEVRLQVAQDALLQDVFEEVNLAVALHELLHCGAELLELGRRQVAQARRARSTSGSLARVATARTSGSTRRVSWQTAAEVAAASSSSCLPAGGLVVAQQEGINQCAGAEAFARGGLEAFRDRRRNPSA